MKITGPIPPNILKCMPPEDRKPLGKAGKTNDEIAVEQAVKSERQLQDNISRLLRIRGIAFFRQRMDRRTTGTVGQPDFLFAINGHACAFEAKMPDNHPTKEQLDVHRAMRANGWSVWLIYSEREAVDVLNELEAK